MKVRQFFQVWGELLSLFEQPAEAFLRKLDDMLLKQKGIERSAIDAKVAERRAFRDAKNWAESDRLRDELVQMGIALQDTAEGSRWEVAK
jgi:cysteinyl-tRNA synthetase